MAGTGPKASEDPQRFDHALTHDIAGVSDERSQHGHRFQGAEVAERGSDDGTDVLVRVAQADGPGRG